MLIIFSFLLLLHRFCRNTSPPLVHAAVTTILGDSTPPLHNRLTRGAIHVAVSLPYP
jgi:hypothetical protein